MRRSSNAAWYLGIVGAVALHAGSAVMAYASFRTDDEAIDDGANALEISMAFESPRAEPTNLPAGPEAEAATAAAAAVEQTVKAEETPLPKERPVETEDPDRLVTEKDVERPAERIPDPSQVQTRAAADSAASEATAPPRIDTAADGVKAVAPAQGTGQSATRVVTTWQKKLVAHLDRNKRYPATADRRSLELQIAFTLDRVGHVLAARVVKSSGNEAFDDAALAMMRRADPVPAPPPIVADDGLSFVLPVVFRAKAPS